MSDEACARCVICGDEATVWLADGGDFCEEHRLDRCDDLRVTGTTTEALAACVPALLARAAEWEHRATAAADMLAGMNEAALRDQARLAALRPLLDASPLWVYRADDVGILACKHCDGMEEGDVFIHNPRCPWQVAQRANDATKPRD